jgi:hypothetical protein
MLDGPMILRFNLAIETVDDPRYAKFVVVTGEEPHSCNQFKGFTISRPLPAIRKKISTFI